MYDVTADNINYYINRIKDIPVLSKEEQLGLAYKYQEENDLEAAKKLIFSNLRFVVYIARKFDGYGLPLADIIQEGNIGLMKAVQRFNPEKEVALATYASQWIHSEIYEFVVRNWNIVKIATTKAQRKLFFNLRKKKKRMSWMSSNEVNDLSKELNVPEKDIYQMEGRLYNKNVAMDEPIGESELTPGELLSDSSTPEELAIKEEHSAEMSNIISKVSSLPEREKDILHNRYLVNEPITLKELAVKYNVSVERIRQLEKQGISKLQKMAY